MDPTHGDFKYPDPEGSAQAIYYLEAKDFIGSYLEKGLPAEWLAQKGNLLMSLAQQGSSSTAARLRHNARAIADFQKHFGAEKFWIKRKPSRCGGPMAR